MKKIVIVSLHYSPAFIGHMMAWAKMCHKCGCEIKLYIDRRYTEFFRGSEYSFCTEMEEVEAFQPDFAVVQNNGTENIAFFTWCSRNRCRILYILHEPYMGIRELMKDGSYWVKQAAACMLNGWLCHLSWKVVLCSEYAEANCRRYMKEAYKKRERLPLLFLDEYVSDNVERKYFSLIGTYATAKGSDIFLQFIRESVQRGYEIDFQIATRSDLTSVLQEEVFQQLIQSGKLLVQHGRDMTTEEINAAYRRSICCWNGYRRSTQSGVLPNAFMQGTPVIATRLGSFEEFVIPGRTGEFIDNANMESILAAYRRIRDHSAEMTAACRNYFLEHFYYEAQTENFRRMIEYT